MMVKPPPSSSSSSKQGQVHRVGVSMENHNNINNNNNKSKQEPRLSGAYIRSLVKHLTTSIKSKDSFNGDHDTLPESLNSTAVSLINDNNNNNMQQQSLPLPLPPPHKKQVRRRQQTSKPYQERLLNMAEARREIVTALKFHRASMKQRQTANNNRLPDQSPSPYPSSLSCSPSVPHFWPIPTTTPPHVHENLDFTLPNQTLGLNLNFHDFKNLDANLYLNYSTSSSGSSSSSQSTSSTAAISLVAEQMGQMAADIPEEESRSTSSTAAISLVTEQMEQMAADIPEEESRSTSSTAAISLVTEQMGQMAADIPEEEVVATTSSSATSTTSSSMSLHHAMDDEGMEEIRSLGEQHQLEWDDTVNLLMSARWFKFLNTFEMEQEDGKFEQVMEFPYCMDIGEIEGMDEEWLA